MRPGLSHLDYEVLIDDSNQRPAKEWCEEQFGPRWQAVGNRTGRWALFWAGRDHFYKYRFCFADESDMTWFILRWA